MLRESEEITRAVGLSGCVILAGGINVSQLVRAANRSVLDLHLTPTRTVLDLWVEKFDDIAGEHVRTVVAHSGSVPAPAPIDGVEVVSDADHYRGPAGAVKDAIGSLPEGGAVFVVEGAGFLERGLETMTRLRDDVGADVVVGVGRDRTPAGVFLLGHKVLNLIPRVGFMDLKEQLLGKAVEKGLHVAVCDLQAGRPTRLRNRRQFLAASGAAHPKPPSARNGLLAKQPFNVNCVCEGAHVSASAHLMDSIVMPGARVGDDAVVVRSIVMPGAVVERGAAVVDCCVSSAGIYSDVDLAREGSRT